MVRQFGGRVEHVYENTIRGFAAAMSATSAAALARDPRVRYVEQDSERFIVETQAGATWGLDRIDQRDAAAERHLHLRHRRPRRPRLRHRHGHPDDAHASSAAASRHGFTAISDGNGTNDCNGHGTHVAGTIGGTTYGVAKGVTLHAVRVLGCNGSGSTSGVIAGVDWVTAESRRRRPSPT